MTRRLLLLPALSLGLISCGTKAPEARRYPLKGEVKALDASAGSATIAHEKIGDWMEAMTMEFPVKPEAELQKLHVGDRIEATVVVEDVTFYVTDVKVGQKPPS